MDLTEKMKFLVEALRGKAEKVTTENPQNPKLKPIEQRRRGYQLYTREAQAMGDPVVSYEEWIQTQE